MIRLRTLGACVIYVGDAVVGPEAERLFGVLLYLATERGRRTARRTIQDLLWPEATDDNGRHNLRQVIYKLRQYGIELGGGHRDVQLYADQITHDPFDVLGSDAATVGDALLGGQLGEYLAGYAPTFSEPWAAWVEAQRAYAHARVARSAVGAMLERRARGRWEDVERLALICLRYDPLNEEATLALAEANALAGSKARALAILDEYIAELGGSTSIQLPATLLRRRIAERLPDPPYTVPSEACFAGRDESLRYLHELFGHARAGRGQTCMVVGEPGIGKSRLAAEFGRVATLQGAQIHQMGCQSRDAARPLSLFVDGVPTLLKMPGALGCSPRSMGYLKRITEFDPTAATPSEDSREAESLYANVRRSVLDLLDAIVAERTLLLVVEDVHWADAASWDILRDMIAWCADRKLLLVLTSRVAHVPHAALERLPMRLHHLAPLAEDPATRVLDALVSERQRRMSAYQHGWLLRAGNGNPLFLRELAIHWLETGCEETVPPSLSALLRERLSRLTPRALRIFQTCAVMGHSASFERLELVLEYKRHEVLDGLQELESAGLLRARAGGVESRHELLAEEASAELEGTAKTYLHRQIALALEPTVLQSAPGDAALLWACAEHWRRAGEERRAWAIVTACGEHLVKLGLSSDAIEVFERAEQYATSDAEIQQCRRGLAGALVHAGRWEYAQRVLRQIIEVDSASDVISSETYEAQVQLLHADMQMGVSIHEVQQRSKAFVADRSLAPMIRVNVALTALALADHACAKAELEETFALVSDLLVHPSVDVAQRETIRMIYNTTCGDLDVALTAAQVLVHYRRKKSGPSELAHSLRCAAHVAQRAGALDTALAYLLDAVTIAEENRLVTHAIRLSGMLAEHYFEALNLSEARAWYTRAVHWTQGAEDPVLHAQNVVFAAKLALAEGKLGEAREHLENTALGVLCAGTFAGQIDVLATRVHLFIAQGEKIPATLLSDFDGTFACLLAFGDLDYAAFVRYLLESTEDSDRAHDRLIRYVVSERRERGEAPALLTSPLQQRMSPFPIRSA